MGGTSSTGQGQLPSSSVGGGLPLTGGNVLPLLLAGLGLMGAGGATLVAARRRQAAQAGQAE